MSPGDETTYKNPVTGEASDPQRSPRYTGVMSFMRTPLLEATGEKLDDLDIGLVGVPFDGGVTYRPGARLGPRAVREQSLLVRTVHHHTKVAPFELCRIRDLGDVPLRNSLDLESCMEDIVNFFSKIHKAGVAPLSVGGDHSISYPILKAIASDRPVAMIHIDAHADTLGPLFGGKFSHASPFFHAANDGLIDPKHCVQIGIRGSEHLGVEDNSLKMGMREIFIEEFEELGVDSVIAEVKRVVGDMPTYFTFDVDALDPVYASGTGTPESGGLTMREVIRLIRGARGVNIVAADLVEVAPMYDPTEVTCINAANILFELTCLLSESVAASRVSDS